jgi:hypothetical protein
LSLAEVYPSPGDYDLERIFAGADAACFGTVAARREVKQEYDPDLRSARVERTFELLEPRCYKGSFPPGNSIAYVSHSPAVLMTDVALADGEVGLFFLKRTDQGAWGLSDPHFGKLRDAFISARGVLADAGIGQLERDLASSLRLGTATPDEIAGDLRVLHGFRQLSGETLDLVRSYSKGPDPLLGAGAFSVLAKAGAPDDLSGFCSYLKAGNEKDSQLLDFSFASIEDLRSLDARPSLECLARTSNAAIRLAAMDAIRAVASPASVPELVRHLDDNDPTMQYLAVISLSEIVKRPGEVGPAMPTFDQDPLSFRLSWKKWWNEIGWLKYGTAGH